MPAASCGFLEAADGSAFSASGAFAVFRNLLPCAPKSGRSRGAKAADVAASQSLPAARQALRGLRLPGGLFREQKAGGGNTAKNRPALLAEPDKLFYFFPLLQVILLRAYRMRTALSKSETASTALDFFEPFTAVA
jgi:hypothetical protein